MEKVDTGSRIIDDIFRNVHILCTFSSVVYFSFDSLCPSFSRLVGRSVSHSFIKGQSNTSIWYKAQESQISLEAGEGRGQIDKLFIQQLFHHSTWSEGRRRGRSVLQIFLSQRQTFSRIRINGFFFFSAHINVFVLPFYIQDQDYYEDFTTNRLFLNLNWFFCSCASAC